MSARSKDRDAAFNSHSRNKASPSAGMDPAKAADASANRTTVTRPISEPPPGSLSGVWRFFEERQDQAHANQCAQRPYHPHLRILNRPWMLHVRRQRKCVILFAQDPVLTSPAEANAETLPCIGSPARVGVAAAITRDVVIRPVAALSGSIRQVLNISALGSGLTDF